MRASILILTLLAASSLVTSAYAQQKPAKQPVAKATVHHPAAAKAMGKFDDWTAATNQEAGQSVCYAFTRATASTPALPGRGDIVLTVTQRPGGRDAVAISAGFAYPPNAAVTGAADAATLDFYTAQRSAFARDGHAAVAAFQRARQLVAKSPTPKGAVTDTFSLKGFKAAYAAILKSCPPAKAAP